MRYELTASPSGAPLLSMPEAAERLNVSPQALRQWCHQGLLDYYGGRRLMFTTPDALQAFRETHGDRIRRGHRLRAARQRGRVTRPRVTRSG